jgi:Protein of unknown function (DUF3253)
MPPASIRHCEGCDILTGNAMTAPKATSTPDPKPADDPVAEMILDTLRGLAAGASISLMDAAKAVADSRRRPADGPELWRRYMNAVRQQATHLARQGRIEIVRKGEPVDPKNFKGVVRLRLPSRSATAGSAKS